jgi:cytochrome P450
LWYIAFQLTSKKYYPLVLERIRSHVLPNATISSETIFDVPNLLGDPFLQACFQETLRLRAQNGSIRIVKEQTTLPVNGNQYFIRKGGAIFIPAPLIHLDPEIYSNVDEYQPERFLSSDLESALIITNDETRMDEGKKIDKPKPPKFFKKGVPVKHYMMPFGGGENLVSFSMKYTDTVYRTSICTE